MSLKKIMALISLAFSVNVFSAATTPMNAVEEVSHVLIKYVELGKIDKSFLTNTYAIKLHIHGDGIHATVQAPSDDATSPNTLSIMFDLKGRLKNVDQTYISDFKGAPLFIDANAATLIDLGAEAVVDHVTEDAELMTIANSAKSIELISTDNTVVMKIKLTSGLIYNVVMDKLGAVISKGMSL